MQNNPGVSCYMRRGHNGIREFGHVIGAAHHLKLFFATQFLSHRQDIDRLALIGQALHSTEDALMRLYIKTLGFKDFDNSIKSVFLQHDSAKYSFFEVFGLRWYFAKHHCSKVK